MDVTIWVRDVAKAWLNRINFPIITQELSQIPANLKNNNLFAILDSVKTKVFKFIGNLVNDRLTLGIALNVLTFSNTRYIVGIPDQQNLMTGAWGFTGANISVNKVGKTEDVYDFSKLPVPWLNKLGQVGYTLSDFSAHADKLQGGRARFRFGLDLKIISLIHKNTFSESFGYYRLLAGKDETFPNIQQYLEGGGWGPAPPMPQPPMMPPKAMIPGQNQIRMP